MVRIQLLKALLVNPWVHDFKAFDFWNKPLGLLMVSSILKKLGCAIDFVDCMDRQSPYFATPTRTDEWGRGKYYCEEIEKPRVFAQIPRRYKCYGMPRRIFLDVINRLETPDSIFMTSSMTYWYRGVFEAISILRRRFPGVKIILGGIYATLCADHARKYSGADIVFTGAVEERIPDLLSALGWTGNAPADLCKCVPDHSVYEKMHYGVAITSRGCPFDCTYCATKYLCNRFSTVPLETAIKQIDLIRKKTRNIAFFDDALLYNRSFPDLLRSAITRKYELNLHASNGLHCRYITEEIARLMFEANFKTIYLSLETINPEVQEKTGGKVSTGEFKTAVQTLTRAGFAPAQIHAYILYGMPDQGHEEIIDSIRLCHELKVNPHLCEFSPIPHTIEYAKTGYDENTDPLYHNNLFHTWYYPEPKIDTYNKIKRLLQQ
ncbi:radical SAM protein [candidate division WOR-3 bacterium]|nr:radical SAM protein [candidate division WOR-3 bacterium]